MSITLKTAQDLGISSEQMKNLARLALHVERQARDSAFDMSYYYKPNRWVAPSAFLAEGKVFKTPADGHVSDKPECGTAGCLAGHGPAAGIPFEGDETWEQYVERVFIGSEPVQRGLLFAMLFSGGHLRSWTDTTQRELASRRIAWLLQRGVPGIYDGSVPGIYDGSLSFWEPKPEFEPAWDLIEQLAQS